jgi:hypothetical protein
MIHPESIVTYLAISDDLISTPSFILTSPNSTLFLIIELFPIIQFYPIILFIIYTPSPI